MKKCQFYRGNYKKDTQSELLLSCDCKVIEEDCISCILYIWQSVIPY